MPDHGRLTEDLVTHASPVGSPLYPPPPWKLPGASVLRLIFETDNEAVLKRLPPKLTRSSPAYAILSVEHYPESPVGEFSAAHLFIGCRAGFFVRAFALQSAVDNPAALSALREVWGFPCRPGEVSLAEANGQVRASVGSGGSALCDIELDEARPVDPGIVHFDPVLTLRLAPSLQEGVAHDLIQLVQVDPDIAVKSAIRGPGAIRRAEGDWAALPCRNPVSAAYCHIDTELPFARFVIPY